MRLLTHNTLQSPTTSTYPLHLTPITCTYTPSTGPIPQTSPPPSSPPHPPSPLIKSLLTSNPPRLNYPAFLKAAQSLIPCIHPNLPSTYHPSNLPQSLPPQPEDDSPFLSLIHALLIDVNVEEGEMKDEKDGRVYRIKNGIPNMMVMEDEV